MGTCEDGIVSYTCTCVAGWEGDNCSIDIDECASRPCQNGATCAESGVDPSIPLDVYMCTCAYGWGDENCDMALWYGLFCSLSPLCCLIQPSLRMMSAQS